MKFNPTRRDVMRGAATGLLMAPPVSKALAQARVTVTEGKYHQVKRMFGKVEKPVLSLKRVAVAGVSLDERLAPGGYRDLTEAEIARLG